ncbi:GABA receptor subunit [Trichuris trichiura]|uniref:GABA receptor subunit n=1 Tax=Trichuris trichiura TaxID=36087 RepID=A0A077ZLJ2_TRITR|nr:GABA receptor subunit [Trichuris trichiura]
MHRIPNNPFVLGYCISLKYISYFQDYTLDFYLRQNWHDPRLDINRLGAKEELTVSWEYTKDIWLPDTFFPNEKKSYFHQATTHNSFLRIKGTGEVLTSQRLTVTASCPMMLQLFPLDSQECTLEIESCKSSSGSLMCVLLVFLMVPVHRAEDDLCYFVFCPFPFKNDAQLWKFGNS